MDKILAVTKKISTLDTKAMAKTQKHLDSLTKPQGSLGRLEELAKQISGITGKIKPQIKNIVIFTLAADHGVTDEGVSAYPKKVTAQMVYNFLNGTAGINVLAKHIGAKVVVADLGVAEKIISRKSCFVDKKIAFGTKNMFLGPAMTREEALKSIYAGIEIFEEELKKGMDIIGTGEMGIGNTTSSSCITAVFTNKPVESVTAQGAGLHSQAMKNKIKVIKKALRLNKPDSKDPIDVLAKVGGFEIAGLVGIILAAAAHKVPVVIDGFISSAAALIAFHIKPKVKEYMIASHCSAEIGHKVILKHIGLNPLLSLDLRLGEGTGAALGISLAQTAVKVLSEMATFKSAHVSQKI